ncbi:Alpha/beta hydrolase fold-1 [Nemania sp. NC0429]|nr:Alpha/beta hydrolase fold-1 [Nemania sp. NC0429]
MSKPYFIIVPGSFAPASLYDEFVELARANGIDIKAMNLKTVRVGKASDAPAPSMYDDAAAIAREVEALADEGREVILIPHSYGGVPATESAKGLSIQERQKQGKKGGLKRIAYKTVVLPSPGQSAQDVLESSSSRTAPPFEADEHGWFHFTDPDYIAKETFSDLPPEKAKRWQNTFSEHSAVSFINPLTHPGYKDVPVSYLLCEDDVVIPPEQQRREIEMVERETGNKVDVTSIRAGHAPTASVPDQVLAWVLDLASKP